MIRKVIEGFVVRRACIVALLLGGATMAGTMSALAEYPERPIRAIVPFAPGGANDVMARVISPQISRMLGQPVLVENRPGAAGNIGIEATAKSAPDGYTILFSATASTQNPALFRTLRFDPLKDIQPIVQIGDSPYLIVVPQAFSVQNVQGLIDYAKKNPGKLNAAAGGIGTRLSVELFQIQNNLQIQIIPYSGTGPVTLALLKGEADLAIMDASSLVSVLASGRVRALAVAGAKRLGAFPNVPTTTEAGVPGYRTGTLFGIYAASGTPAAIVQKLHATVSTIITMPEVIEQLHKLGAEPTPKSTEEFVQLYRREIQTWKDIVAKAKIPLEE